MAQIIPRNSWLWGNSSALFMAHRWRESTQRRQFQNAWKVPSSQLLIQRKVTFPQPNCNQLVMLDYMWCHQFCVVVLNSAIFTVMLSIWRNVTGGMHSPTSQPPWTGWTCLFRNISHGTSHVMACHFATNCHSSDTLTQSFLFSSTILAECSNTEH